MKVGTKSILFGAHCWFIHPWFVALAWWKLFGFPKDIRLWVAFFVHDLGYWGKPNMDGPEGEEHVWLGANIMHRLFDRVPQPSQFELEHLGLWEIERNYPDRRKWLNFCLYHSRFYAKKHNKPYSELCVADKLAIALEPWWLYLPRAILSGEIKEYIKLADTRNLKGEPALGKYAGMNVFTLNKRQWFERVQTYCRAWAYEHKDMKQDLWTPSE